MPLSVILASQISFIVLHRKFWTNSTQLLPMRQNGGIVLEEPLSGRDVTTWTRLYRFGSR